MKSHFFIAMLIFLLPFYCEAQVVNIESKRIITDTTGWSGALGLNFTLVQNTKRLFVLGGKAHVQWKSSPKNLFLLLGEYGFTEGDDRVFQDYGFGHFRFTRHLTERLALESFAQAQYNKVFSLRYRGLLGAGPRYELVSMKTFNVFIASLVMLEREILVDGGFFEGGRLSNYVSFTYKPTSWFKLINTTYYQPRLNQIADYRISGESSLLWTITKKLKFVSSFNYRYDVFPPVGTPNGSFRLKNGLKYRF